MNTEIAKISQIRLNEANPRIIQDDKFDKLVDSILVFPKMLEIRPIVVTDTFVALGGNMRFRALSFIASMSVAEIRDRLEGLRDFQKKTDAERDVLCEHWAEWRNNPMVPVIKASDLSEEQQREFIIKDNVGFGEWNYDALAEEWDREELNDWGFDEWLDESSEDTSIPSNTAHEDDDFNPDKEITKRCSPGDVWELGNHVLMCGDSTDDESVKKLLGGAFADMVFTDPPYGVSIGDKNATLNNVQKAGRCVENIKNDTLGCDELYPILVKAMSNARENCKEDASYYVTSPQGGELGMMMMMKDAGLPVRHILIWEKNSATFSLGRLDYDYQHEPIFYTWTKKHHNYRGGEYRTTIWRYDKPRKCDLHPTMKPVALVANALLDGTKEGDIVLDLFGGSGTTLIACEQLNRKCRIMELDPHYCDVIISRWEKLTGKQAKQRDA